MHLFAIDDETRAAATAAAAAAEEEPRGGGGGAGVGFGVRVGAQRELRERRSNPLCARWASIVFVLLLLLLLLFWAVVNLANRRNKQTINHSTMQITRRKSGGRQVSE